MSVYFINFVAGNKPLQRVDMKRVVNTLALVGQLKNFGWSPNCSFTMYLQCTLNCIEQALLVLISIQLVFVPGFVTRLAANQQYISIKMGNSYVCKNAYAMHGEIS